MATSVTVRPMGPAVSWLWAMGIMPYCDIRPTVGFRPTIRLLEAGQVIEPSVSVPTAAAHRFVAVATAEPELEPQAVQFRIYGFCVKPPRPLQPFRQVQEEGQGANPRKFAHSERFALPRTIAPAARNRLVRRASAGTPLPSNANEPAVVCRWSSVAILSFKSRGMPWSGPRSWPLRRSLSSCAA